MNEPILIRQEIFQAYALVFDLPLGPNELDFYKPRRETVSQWVNEIEREISALRFKSGWGRATATRYSGNRVEPNPFKFPDDV